MSSRNLRKLAELKAKAELKTLDESGDDFEPLFTNKASSAYAALAVSSPCQSESDESVNEDEDKPAPSTSSGRRNKNNKRNKRKRNKKTANKGAEEPGPSSVELDEVEQSLREVNELLGELEVPKPMISTKIDLLKIEAKFLEFRNDLNRLLGPDKEEESKRRKNPPRTTRRLIVLSKDNYSFTCRGIRMVLIEVKDGVKMFKFVHNHEYQKNMHELMHALKPHFDEHIREEPEVFPSNTVEALLENLNLYFQMDEINTAVHYLEEAIYFMQIITENSFSYVDGKTRLEYKYVENRAFHIALLQYVHVMTTKACHRTALEVAKLMLNLDPSDPLGVIFIIDTLAIRARQFQWLVDIYDHWKDEKDASRLFHMRYSLALATWHIAKASKDEDDMKAANAMIKLALVKYPNVAVMIMTLIGGANKDVMSHKMFTTLVQYSTSVDLKSLQLFYAKYIYQRWRGRGIMDWVTKNALEIIERFKNDPTMREQTIQCFDERKRLFRKMPLEIKRHMSTITPMSEWLVEREVPQVQRTLTFNPYPAEGQCIDVHRYYKDWGVVYPAEEQPNRGVIGSFISSLIPEVPNTQGGCSDRYDIIRLIPGVPLRRVTIEEAMFREEIPDDDDMDQQRIRRRDLGYNQRRRRLVLSRERSFAKKVRSSKKCSDALSFQGRSYVLTPRKNKGFLREAAYVRRHN